MWTSKIPSKQLCANIIPRWYVAKMHSSRCYKQLLSQELGLWTTLHSLKHRTTIEIWIPFEIVLSRVEWRLIHTFKWHVRVKTLCVTDFSKHVYATNWNSNQITEQKMVRAKPHHENVPRKLFSDIKNYWKLSRNHGSESSENYGD